jgi:ADP-ribose pyrophosphatase YjhB (NUDIX family)
MKRVECAGGIVVGSNRHILVITNQLGKHTLPKGTCEEDETPIGTARREITEESGVTQLEVVRYLGTIKRVGFTAIKADTPSVIKYISMFHCTTEQTELCPMASDVVSARWVEPAQLGNQLTWPEEYDFFLAHEGTLHL